MFVEQFNPSVEEWESIQKSMEEDIDVPEFTPEQLQAIQQAMEDLDCDFS